MPLGEAALQEIGKPPAGHIAFGTLTFAQQVEAIDFVAAGKSAPVICNALFRQPADDAESTG